MLTIGLFPTTGRLPFAAVLFILGLILIPAHPARATQDPARIAGLLGSQDPADRAMGVTAVHDLGQTAMPGLVETLRQGTAAERYGSVYGLAMLPVPALAEEPLLDALGDEEPQVRKVAALTLAKIGAPAARSVAERLAHGDNDVRVAAALSLSKMGPEAVPALIRLLERKDPMVQAKAAWLLGAMGPDAMAAVPALIRALRTDDMRLVHLLAETIDLIGPDPAAVYQLLTKVGLDGEVIPFGRIGAKAAPTLVKLLTRPGTPTGDIALYTLARMGKEAEPALRAALATGTEGQQAAAALLLTGIDPKLAHVIPEDLRRTLAGAMHTE